MPAHKKLTDAGRARIEEVARIRDETPTDKELARECGVSTHTVRHEMEDYRRNGARKPVSRGAKRTVEEIADALIREYSL